MTALYRHQSAALGPIVVGKPTYLGFDPGLGKSRTALEAAKARGNVRRLLIISPASGRYVWERECKLWAPGAMFTIVKTINDLMRTDSQHGIVLVTYGLLSQKNSPFATYIADHRAFDMTVLDEATAVKNSGANRTRAILGKMLPKLGYLLPMSGTPAPNHAGELYPILRANFPQAIAHSAGRPMTEIEFQDAFCRVESKPFGPGGRSIRVVTGSKNIPALRERMDGYMIRVRKEDVLKDLPPIRWDVIPVQPSSEGFAALPSVPTGLTDDEVLQWFSRGDEHVMRVRRMIGLAKVQSATEYIDEFLVNLDGSRKVLVFAHHAEVIAKLVAGLGNWKPAVVTGATSASDRTKAVDQFLNDPNCFVFVGNIQAAGTALTLVGPKCRCADVFFVEATYSPADNYQAACRVHRIGQHDGVVARFLTARGTIDDRIQEILARKASDFDQLFN